MVPFIIEESSNLTVRNFSIDWDVPFTLEGLVVNNNSSDNTFDIEVTTPYKVEYERLYISLERESSPYDTKFGDRFAIGEKNNIEVGQNIIWNPKTMAPYYNTSQYAIAEHGIKATELNKGLIRLEVKAKKMPPIGSIFVSKGAHLSNRLCPAFRVFKSKDILLNNINVHHAGAMGLIAERSENITLDNFNVVLKEGSGRMVTTTADATHFCNVKGKVIYGYTWKVRTLNQGEGYYRLTFSFDEEGPGAAILNTDIDGDTKFVEDLVPTTLSEDGEEERGGTPKIAIVDDKGITYMDILITPKIKGGGGNNGKDGGGDNGSPGGGKGKR